jgi:hypothetical protein
MALGIAVIICKLGQQDLHSVRCKDDACYA